MKRILLVVLALFTIIQLKVSAQATFYIEWTDPATITVPSGTTTIKRNGVIHNNSNTLKQLLFRGDISKIVDGHNAAFCFGDLCYFQYPDDDPYERDPQQLYPGGSLPVYSLLNNYGTDGTSIALYELFDKNNPNDKIEFTITYVIGKPASVREASEIGINVSPLPASDIVHITSSDNSLIRSIDVYTTGGVRVRTYGVSGTAVTTIPISTLAAGNYRFVFTMTNGSMAQAPLSIVR